MVKALRHITLIGVTLAMLSAGCRQETELEKLQKENPFKTQSPRPPLTTLLVSCEYVPLQLPASTVITDIEGWPGDKPAASPADTTNTTPPDTTNASPDNKAKTIPADSPAPRRSTTFRDEDIRNWNLNGFDVTVASMQTWPRFRQGILNAGGSTLLQANAIFRNRDEHADFGTIWKDDKQSIIVSSSTGSINGYTLGWGQCGFRVTCQPVGQNDQSDQLLINITPIFVGAEAIPALERDQAGSLRQTAKRPETLFSELTLQGVIPKDSYICISPKIAKDNVPNLGNIFLTKTLDGRNLQMICLLTPQMQIVNAAPPEVQRQNQKATGQSTTVTDN